MKRQGSKSSPETWDELTEVCATLKETFPDVYPLGLSANNNEEGTFHFMSFLLSTGATVCTNLTPTARLRRLPSGKIIWITAISRRMLSGWGQTEVNAQFMSGNLAMQVNGPWNISVLNSDAPDKNWDVFLIPKDQEFASVLGGENFAITTACEDLELGWAYLSTQCDGQHTAGIQLCCRQVLPEDRW